MRPGSLTLLARREVVFTNNSRAGARDYARWLGLGADAFRVVPNGFEFPVCDVSARAADLRRELGTPADAPVVGTIIRFSEEKRPLLWLEAATIVAARKPEVHFHVFGGGAMLDAARKLVADRGLAGRIKLPGITREAWAALATMDVFALVSRMEGLPNVLIEAQAMGVPVVSTGKGGMAETYVEGETGLTAKAETAEAIAEAMQTLLADAPRRRRMSEQAGRHVRSKFAIDAMLTRTLEAFAAAERQADRLGSRPFLEGARR
jgi:glycosyltransferase involved in cell wall biosynthesis